MKIGVIARGDLNDSKLWSGTIYYLSKYISDDYEIVPVIVPKSIVEKIMNKIIRMMSAKKSKRTVFSLPVIKKRLGNEMQKAMTGGCKLFFAPAASELIASGGVPDDCKLIYLSDATYHLMIDYYYFDSMHDQKIRNLFESRALERADAVIYCSDWAKSDAVSYYHANDSKINVLPLPSYIDDTYSCSPRVLPECGVIKILFVGVDWKRKGADIAINCLHNLNKKNTSWHFELNIVGLEDPGNMGDDSIKFWGRLKKSSLNQYSQLVKLYEEAHIFLLPTRAECAGIVFSEAAMFGLPVFTHKTGGTETYVKEDYNGRLLELGVNGNAFAEAILQMLCDGKLSEYSKNARSLYEKNLNSKAWMIAFNEIVEKLA